MSNLGLVLCPVLFFFFNDTATTEIYTLSLHDALPISRLAMESSDPAVRVEDAVGRLRVIGDSMDVQLARVRLPHSALRDARGTLRWPHGPLLFDLRLRADSATLNDFPFIDRRFAGVPGTGVVSGDVRLRSHAERVLEVGLDPLRLAYHGGTVAGRLTALSVADSGLVALRDADLDAREFDLEFARPFLDTLPFAGRLTGHTLATGPLANGSVSRKGRANSR